MIGDESLEISGHPKFLPPSMVSEVDSFQDTVDRRAICPTSGRICGALTILISLYETPVDSSIAANLPPQLNPINDQVKLSAKILNHKHWANKIDCQGEEEGICPAREAMNTSESRVRRVNFIRRVLRRNK